MDTAKEPTPVPVKVEPLENDPSQARLALDFSHLPVPTESYYANAVVLESRNGVFSSYFGKLAANGSIAGSSVSIDIATIYLPSIASSFNSEFLKVVEDLMPGETAPTIEREAGVLVGCRVEPAHLVLVRANSLLSVLDFYAFHPGSTETDIAVLPVVRVITLPTILRAFVQSLLAASRTS
jgi:hypothetical protein